MWKRLFKIAPLFKFHFCKPLWKWFLKLIFSGITIQTSLKYVPYSFYSPIEPFKLAPQRKFVGLFWTADQNNPTSLYLDHWYSGMDPGRNFWVSAQNLGGCASPKICENQPIFIKILSKCLKLTYFWQILKWFGCAHHLSTPAGSIPGYIIMRVMIISIPK